MSDIEQVWMKEAPTVLQTLNTNADEGLNPAEAAQRLNTYGPNELEERGGKSPFLILFEQFTDTMVLILIAAAVLSGFLGKPLEAIAISAIVVLFGLLGFIQEYRAEQAMEALKKMSVPLVRVRRGGNLIELSAKQLVPGDIVQLEAGSNVPADLRLVEEANLRIQEAALTGESEPVEKQAEPVPNPEVGLGDRKNMAYMGTSVTYGRGVGVVTATGMNTELGHIAELIQNVEEGRTQLQEQLNSVGTLLAGAGGVVAILISVIGLLRGEELADMVLTAISVAVAVIPEGLPAVVTVTLALGAQRMLRRSALIRKLPAVETLGSVSVICSDKTGTLTENRMTVTVIDVAGRFIELTGTSKHPTPSLRPTTEDVLPVPQGPAVELALIGGALCNDASLKPDEETGRYLAIGDPTEGALLVAAEQAGMNTDRLADLLPRVDERPFDSDRKRMTTVHRIPDENSPIPQVQGEYIAFTKGSVDGLLDLCDEIWVEDHPEPISGEWLDRMQVANDDLAQKGMRVLGIAFKTMDEVDEDATIENNLTFVGLVGMIDPPRPEVKEAIRKTKSAGIRTIMITGDHPLTARFIAYDLGITSNGRVKTGQDLERMTQAELEDVIDDVSVFARVTPAHKLQIVDTLQKRGQVVAMTGDGVNDSPALRKSDIGVAMGITGTDVSKEASQMVLLDDNFTTIVAAVEEGRTIYDNLRSFVKFSIAGNFGKVLVMLIAPFFGIALALQPLQLLWLNLLTDGLLGLGLGVEPSDARTMSYPPRKKDEAFLDGFIIRQILWVGGLIGLVSLAVGVLFENAGLSEWQTMIFTTLAFMQIGQALASRSREVSTFTLGLLTNPTLLVMVFVTFGLQLIAIYVPFLKGFFGVEQLTPAQLALCIGLGSLTFFAIELEKFFLRRRSN